MCTRMDMHMCAHKVIAGVSNWGFPQPTHTFDTEPGSILDDSLFIYRYYSTCWINIDFLKVSKLR